MIHCYLLLAHCKILWYNTFSFWPTGYPYITLLSSTGPLVIFYSTLLSSIGQLDISMVHSLFTIGPLVIPMLHCYLLLADWIWSTTLSYWPTGYLYGSLSFPIGSLAISMVHYCFLLDQWLSLLYIALFY